MSFICNIHNYTEYNQQEMCSLHLTHPSAHTPGAVGSPGSSWGFGPLLKGLTLSRGQSASVVSASLYREMHLTEDKCFTTGLSVSL